MIDKIIIFSHFYYAKNSFYVSMLNLFSIENRRFAISAPLSNKFFKLKTKKDFNIILTKNSLKIGGIW